MCDAEFLDEYTIDDLNSKQYYKFLKKLSLDYALRIIVEYMKCPCGSRDLVAHISLETGEVERVTCGACGHRIVHASRILEEKEGLI